MKSKFMVPVEDRSPAKIYWQDLHRNVTATLDLRDADRLTKLCDKHTVNGKTISVSKMVRSMILHCLKELE